MILTTFGWGNGRVHLLRERAGEEEEREMNMKMRINREKQDAGKNPKFFHPGITAVDILVYKCESDFPCPHSPLTSHFHLKASVLTVSSEALICSWWPPNFTSYHTPSSYFLFSYTDFLF